MPSTDDVKDDLTLVSGIGPVFAARLRAAGIDTFEKLAATDDARLAEIADVPVSRVEGWRDQASKH
jgi:polyhydroxyalkanoate synthase